MTTIAAELLQVLNALGESAAFCATGDAAAVLPGLEVAGIGDVGVPISAADAKRLIQQAAQAPYGWGEQTIVDTNVRCVWQLEPAQFQLRNPEWKSCLALIVEAVRQEFGIAQKVEAQLYKLLVYEKGSFFTPHRDTEKAERMFATLVVCLPSKHEGGTLIVSHDGQTKRIDFGGAASQFQIQYAAFYADCQHEVTPVASGYRVCLVYNLAIAKSKQQPSAPVSGGAVNSVAELLTKMFAGKSRDKIAIPLKHQYTEAGLEGDSAPSCVGDIEEDESDGGDFDDDDWDEDDAEDESRDSAEQGAGENSSASQDIDDTGEPPVLRLKGGDQARMNVLVRAAEKAGCQAFLALLTHWQSGSVDYGSLEYAPRWSRSRRYGDDFDIAASQSTARFEEVFDESMSLSHWFDATGRKQPFQELELDEEEIVSDVAPQDRPYRQEIHEATGNEGVSMERWYRQAVVVIWPQDRFFRILAGAGPASAVPALEELVRRTEYPEESAECREFSKEIVARWKEVGRSTFDPWGGGALSHARKREGEETPLTTRMLRMLHAIGDEKLAIKFVRDILPVECVGSEGAELVGILDQHGWKKFGDPLREVFAKQKPGDYGRELIIPVTLFEALCGRDSKMTKERRSVCLALAEELEQAIDRWDRRKWDSWQREQDHRSGIVEPVVRSLAVLEAAKALDRFVSRAISDPAHYDLHTVLVSAVKSLLRDQSLGLNAVASCGRSACDRLYQHCLADLRSRTASKPQAPADWSRDAKLGCTCADCRELAAFLKSKTESVHRFARRKDLRQHLHQQIEQHHCDVTHVTERKGSPQTLVCTKTQASYERRLTQFETDQRLLAELQSLAAPPPAKATQARHTKKNLA